MTPVDETRAWIEAVVLGLDLCPFAHAPWRAGRVRLVASRAEGPMELLAELLGEARLLADAPEPDTTLLVVPHLLADFDDLLDLQAAGEAVLEAEGLDEVVQLVGFHPDYAFADADPEDPANATNRSPHPTLHLLRRAQVADAVARHPDVHGIAARNVALLRARAQGD